jgi:hypothetical protein
MRSGTTFGVRERSRMRLRLPSAIKAGGCGAGHYSQLNCRDLDPISSPMLVDDLPYERRTVEILDQMLLPHWFDPSDCHSGRQPILSSIR